MMLRVLSSLALFKFFFIDLLLCLVWFSIVKEFEIYINFLFNWFLLSIVLIFEPLLQFMLTSSLHGTFNIIYTWSSIPLDLGYHSNVIKIYRILHIYIYNNDILRFQSSEPNQQVSYSALGSIILRVTWMCDFCSLLAFPARSFASSEWVWIIFLFLRVWRKKSCWERFFFAS